MDAHAPNGRTSAGTDPGTDPGPRSSDRRILRAVLVLVAIGAIVQLVGSGPRTLAAPDTGGVIALIVSVLVLAAMTALVVMDVRRIRRGSRSDAEAARVSARGNVGR